MIKIGDFSKLAHVSIKTLHHYGDLGLLKPAHIDRYSGYRYYSLDQLPCLNRILALKDLGFSLEQIAQLLDENLSIAEMRGMLRMKRFELSETLKEEESRLARIELRLRRLEQEGRPPEREIAIKEVPPQTVLSARAVAANENILIPVRESLKELLQNYLDRARMKPTGPWFAIIDDLPYDEHNLEVELAVGVRLKPGQRSADWGESPVGFQDLESVQNMASLIHEGDIATLPQTYTTIYAWSQSNGYKIIGPCREVYLSDAGIITAPAITTAPFTEVQCPVERATIPISIHSTTKRKERPMEPKIVSKPAFKAVGLSYVGKNENNEIPQMWDEFNPRVKEIKGMRGQVYYGLCFAYPEGASAGEFEYVSAVEVEDDSGIPEKMVFREVPAYKYVVFTHHGKLDKLGETYQYIYDTWLPQSGLEVHPDKYDMEVYDERFMHDSDDSAFDIYVAIKE